MARKEELTMKEKVAITQTEVKYIKRTLDDICPKIQEMHDTFIKGEGKISAQNNRIYIIEKTLNGNGKPGLIKEVQQITTKIAYYMGGVVAAITIITFLINIYF